MRRGLSIAVIALVGSIVGCGGAAFTLGDGSGTDGGGSSSSGGGSGSGGGGSGSGGGSASSGGGSGSSGSGSSSSGTASSGSGSTSSSSGGSSGGCSGCVDGGPAAPCPAVPPSAGHACTDPSLVCEYGTSTIESCNTVATCTQSQWQIQTPGPANDCSTSPGPQCPATFSAVPRSTHCDHLGLICDYAQGRCACETLGGPAVLDASASARWTCQDPVNMACPQPRPLLGTPCAPNGTTCDYGACGVPGGSAEQCTGGIWKPALIPCPLVASGG